MAKFAVLFAIFAILTVSFAEEVKKAEGKDLKASSSFYGGYGLGFGYGGYGGWGWGGWGWGLPLYGWGGWGWGGPWGYYGGFYR